MGSCWWPRPNSEGQTQLHKVSLVGDHLLLSTDARPRFHLPYWAPQGHVCLRTWGQGHNCTMEGDRDG